MAHINKQVLVIGPDRREKGGVATVMAQFYEHRHDISGIELSFLTTWRPNWRKVFGLSLARYRRLLRKQKIDVVHIHVSERGSFWRAALLIWLTPKRVPIIYHTHAAEFDVFFESQSQSVQHLIQRTLNRVQLIVTLGDNWFQYFRELTQTDVTILHNAVAVAPKMPPVDLTSYDIVTFGRIGQRKGSFDIISVAKEIHELDERITFTLYGDGSEEDRRALQDQIAAANLTNVVRLREWVTDIREPAQHAMLHFLPSYHEGLPMAMLETMAQGVPNVVTPVGDIQSVVDSGQNGYLVTPGNITAMTAAIRDYAWRTPNERRNIAENAWQTIKNNYSEQQLLARLAMIYERISE